MSARHRSRFLAILLLIALVVNASAGTPFSLESTPGQLPKSVVPRHYAIRIQPDLAKFTTSGSMTVDIEALRPVKQIVLNALDMEITGATLIAGQETALRPRLSPGGQTLILKLPAELPKGKYRLAIDFKGEIGEQAQGLFYAKYAAPSGKKVMLGTQMEPTDARRMFPCWDEPVFRATFALTMILPEKFKAYSNMPIESETPVKGGLKEVKFGTTPPMASYLVVMVAGELEEIKDKVDGVQIRVVTTEGKKEQGRYALDATKKLLAYYNRYFGIKYSLPKLDQIAIPGGFSGAMENWGGITYNESTVLFDPKTSSQQTRKDVFITVAHEMSHQWFGNLVTTAWWDNLWLNEGFATWMETKATDHFNPEWEMWLSAAADKTGVMSSDARTSTHPIQQPVSNESDANDAFDTITYQKGGAILRMLENYLGPEVFRQGVHEYLSAHSYSNATTADLWQALEKVSGKPISAIAAGWTEQPGLPVVSIKTASANGKQTVSLKQERFTVDYPDAEPVSWKIPFTWMDATHRGVHDVLLEGKSAPAAIDDAGSAIKANAGNVGYYRVLYDPTLFARLQKEISKLPPADQLNLLNDGWAMVEANRASSTNYFALVEALRHVTTFAIWDQIISTLDTIDELQQKQSNRQAFQAYARFLLQPQLRRLGWQPRSHESGNDGLLRNRVIGALGHFGDAAVISESKARFQRFLAAPGSLAPDLRPSVLGIVGRYSDKPTYDHLHDLARNAAGTEERKLYYNAMAAALDPALAKETLAISLTDETVPQEATVLVSEVAGAGEQPDLAWEFASSHINELLARVDSFYRNSYVSSILASLSDAAHADELESYVKKHLSDDAVAKTRETAETIRFKSALKRRELPVLDRWIATELANLPMDQ
ncbi:MAG: pepN [Pedosphaera sp.]|nr:pepN [Pedosphaera sp.]